MDKNLGNKRSYHSHLSEKRNIAKFWKFKSVTQITNLKTMLRNIQSTWYRRLKVNEMQWKTSYDL